MFTGIIESAACVGALTPIDGGARLELEAVPFASDLSLGESVAVNGCCLTVTGGDSDGRVRFDLLAQTLRVTNLGTLSAGDRVNLERALAAGQRLSGHYVQGHVDTTSSVQSFEQVGQDHRLVLKLPAAYRALVVERGSIAVDGISLTVAELGDETLTIWIIPHTHEVTNLQQAKAGSTVNLEFDVLAKYVRRMFELQPHGGSANG